MIEEIRESLELLSKLISIPRVSRNETAAADIMQTWMQDHGLCPVRIGNNLLLESPDPDPSLPTIMLNAHIDTVKPVASWSRDPHMPSLEDDRLYGLGSNDCGGGLVTLLQVFRHLIGKNEALAKANYVYLASCEEEVSGTGGIRMVIPLLNDLLHGRTIDVAIVGEPTGMQPAVAEKGLMVIDMVAHGKSGHAARGEGINAIYEALDDMQWIRNYKFEKVSPFLGPTVMNLTIINSGTQHNVIPDECKMTIDVRSNEYYDNEKIFDFIAKNTRSECTARSFHLRSSSISLDHPLVQHCTRMGMKPFGSPTLSDQALMPWPSLKIGPGESSRSHSADEFICISELEHAYTTYLKLLLE